ncbi:hypothetical protein G7Y79_00032g066920 [Physcia stellaris]|nr:hypothetical protein G7Y79_00032g066920 [Physcia stellaris]
MESSNRLEPTLNIYSSARIGAKPFAPATYTIKVAEHFGADTIEVVKISNYDIHYEVAAQDLVYAYEGAWNQLVAAEGEESTAVKNGVYQQTGTFRACGTNLTKEKFTLQQLKNIIEALLEYAELFSLKDLEFTYKLQGQRKHVIGLITVPTDYDVAARPRIPRDPFQLIAWDTLHLHPPATVKLYSYGPFIPIRDFISAVIAIYRWGWDLIAEYDTDNILLHIREPILIHEDQIRLDMKPDSETPEWLPLWALRSIVMSIFDFGLRFGMRELSVMYEDEGKRKIWGRQKGATMPSSPPYF